MAKMNSNQKLTLEWTAIPRVTDNPRGTETSGSGSYVVSVVLGVKLPEERDASNEILIRNLFSDWPSNWPNSFKVCCQSEGVTSSDIVEWEGARAQASDLWKEYFGVKNNGFQPYGTDQPAPEVDASAPVRSNNAAKVAKAVNNRRGVGLAAQSIFIKALNSKSGLDGVWVKAITELNFRNRLEVLQWEKGEKAGSSWWQDFAKEEKRGSPSGSQPPSHVEIQERNLHRLAAFPSIQLEEGFRAMVGDISGGELRESFKSRVKQTTETHGYDVNALAELALFHWRRIRPYAFYNDSAESQRASTARVAEANNRASTERKLGFAERLSLISNHPPLMRRLGLVFDLEVKNVPKDVCLIWVEPVWSNDIVNGVPPEGGAGQVEQRSFRTRVKWNTEHGLFPVPGKDQEELLARPGYLNLEKAGASLDSLDVDGAGLKLIQGAHNEGRTLVEQVVLTWYEGHLVSAPGTPAANKLLEKRTPSYHPLSSADSLHPLPRSLNSLHLYLTESGNDHPRVWSDRRWLPTCEERCELEAKLPHLKNEIHSDNFKGFLISAMRNREGQESAYILYLSDPDQRSLETSMLVPFTRTAGLSLVLPSLPSEVHRALNRTKELFEQCACSTEPVCLWAEDLLIGYVPEVWVPSLKKWQSLSRRKEYYKAMSGEQVCEETDGMVTIGPTHTHDETDSPQGEGSPSKDLNVCQSLFRWEGWNLAVPVLTSDSHAHPSDQIKVEAIKKTMPKLRFMGDYRVRLKTIDLAGNYLGMRSSECPPLQEPEPEELNSEYVLSKKFRREEAILPPEILLDGALSYEDAPTRGLTRCVIHQDANREYRWIVPPRVSAKLVEWHGMFDESKSIEELGEFDDVELTEAGGFPTAETRSRIKKDADSSCGLPLGLPVRRPPSSTKTFPANSKDRYYPDPWAIGVAYRLTDSAGLVFPGEGMTGRIDFYQLAYGRREWPKAKSFRICLVGGGRRDGKGNLEPQAEWHDSIRVLTIELPPGMQVKLELSSYFGRDKKSAGKILDEMEAWQHREAALNQITSLKSSLANIPSSNSLLDERDAIEKDYSALMSIDLPSLAMEVGLPILTPIRVIELVHAVDRPLKAPLLACVDDTPNVPPRKCAIEAASLEGRLVRSRNSAKVDLGFEVCADSQTTGEIELHAAWDDVIDDPDPEKPVTPAGFRGGLPTPIPSSEVVGKWSVQLTNGLNWGIVFPVNQQDVPVINDFSKGAIPGSGTQYRKVTYWVKANSRFRPEFPSESTLTFSQQSLPKIRHVLSSSPPRVPSVAYLVPELGWKLQVDTSEQASPPTLSHTRVGGLLKVYLDRPWFTSGAGEKLGIVLWPFRNPVPSEKNKGLPDIPQNLVTQWGMDPIFALDKPFSLLPNVNHFPGAVIQQATIKPEALIQQATTEEEEREWPVELATFEPVFNFEKQMWSCSIQVAPIPSYCTFIRLALVRYQEHSIPGCQVSSIALADFAQLLPDRSVTIVRDTTNCRTLHVKVLGSLNNPERTVSIAGKESDLAVTLPGNCYTVKIHKPMALTDNGGFVWMEDDGFTITTKMPAGQKDVLWNGTVTWPNRPCGKRRLVVMEHEWHLAVTDNDPSYEQKSRVVYEDVLEV